MTAVLPAKVNAEFFVECPTYTDSNDRVVHAFWDHFLKGDWAGSPSAGLSNQADSAVLTIQAGETEQFLTTSFDSFSTVDYPVLVGRVTSFSATNFVVQIQKASDSGWVSVYTGTEAERFTVEDLTEFYEGAIKGLRIYCTGSPDDTVTVDYLVICKKAFFPTSADLEDTITVTKSLLNDEVSSATVTLSNFLDLGDTYLNLDDCGFGIIWAARDEESLTDLDSKLFGGKIASIKQDYYAYNVADVIVELLGHASELFASPELVYKLYEGEYGDTIIDDTLDLCGYLSKYPHAVGWFDGGHSGSQIADTDDRMSSQHSVEYDEVQPLKGVQEIAEKASNPSDVIGFDVFETASGCLIGHLRESQDFICPVSPTLESAVKVIDPHRVVNRQKVYGATGKKIPSDESWTESTDGWTVDSGEPLVFNTDYYVEGTGSIEADFISGTLQFRRSISPTVYGFGKRAAKRLKFHRKRRYTGLGPDSAVVQLWAPDSSNYFSAGIELHGGFDLDWKQIDLPLGVNSEITDSNSNGKWTKVGNPSWQQLTQICFKVQYALGIAVLIDGLYFCDMPFSASTEDTDSIAKHGVNEAEPIVDQTLMSDAECESKANAVIASKKDVPITIEPFIVEGDARYQVGDIMSDGVDSFRIIAVEHLIVGVNWKAQLTVSEVL